MSRLSKILTTLISGLLSTSVLALPKNDLMDLPECKDRPALDSIKFNSEFFEDIDSGKKTATTRMRIRCYAAGSKVKMLDTENTDKGQLRITQVSKIRFEQLSEAHAKKENCTLLELQEGLLEIYGPDIKTADLSFVEFQVPYKN